MMPTHRLFHTLALLGALSAALAAPAAGAPNTATNTATNSATTNATTSAPQASGPAQFRAFIASTHSAQARFSQQVMVRSGRQPQLSSGQFAFARPGRFRWLYEKPYYQLLVADGQRLWIFDRDLEQVTVKQLGDALGSTPAALLAGDNDLEKNFSIRDGGNSAGLGWLIATPRAGETSFREVRIGLRDNLPQRMEIDDNFGQTTTLMLHELRRNPRLPTDLFQFKPPAGIDVIGE